jgi:predicted Zn-ribbon and HTH transcriptional regulator
MKIPTLYAISGCIIVIVFGFFLTIITGDSIITPFKQAHESLVRIEATSDPQTILNEIKIVKESLPKSGNPVLIAPTDDTDFGFMQKDLDVMQSSANDVVYNSGSNDLQNNMLNIHAQASTLVFNLLDAEPYMYLSSSFLFANIVWILRCLWLYRVATKK